MLEIKVVFTYSCTQQPTRGPSSNTSDGFCLSRANWEMTKVVVPVEQQKWADISIKNNVFHV